MPISDTLGSGGKLIRKERTQIGGRGLKAAPSRLSITTFTPRFGGAKAEVLISVLLELPIVRLSGQLLLNIFYALA